MERFNYQMWTDYKNIFISFLEGKNFVKNLKINDNHPVFGQSLHDVLNLSDKKNLGLPLDTPTISDITNTIFFCCNRAVKENELQADTFLKIKNNQFKMYIYTLIRFDGFESTQILNLWEFVSSPVEMQRDNISVNLVATKVNLYTYLLSPNNEKTRDEFSSLGLNFSNIITTGVLGGNPVGVNYLYQLLVEDQQELDSHSACLSLNDVRNDLVFYFNYSDFFKSISIGEDSFKKFIQNSILTILVNQVSFMKTIPQVPAYKFNVLSCSVFF